MLRGEFIRGDGLVIPNNITTAGAAWILNAAIRNQVTSLFVGLCDAVPDASLTIDEVTEPAIATNGYARQVLNRDTTDWPVAATLNGEAYIESKAIVFAATGGNFSQSIRRMMLVTNLTALTGSVVALSSALPSLLLVTPTTDLTLRTFKYRVFLR